MRVATLPTPDRTLGLSCCGGSFVVVPDIKVLLIYWKLSKEPIYSNFISLLIYLLTYDFGEEVLQCFCFI